MSSETSQVGNFITKADAALKEAGGVTPPQNEPLVPFQTALKLTYEQEKKMLEHAFKRFEDLNRDSGRDVTIQPNWWMNQAPAVNIALMSQGLQPYETFMAKRSRYDATFSNDVAWRPYNFGPDNIFYSSNLTVPLVRRICRQMIARAKNAFFGASPWFSASPTPVSGIDEIPDLEDKIDDIQAFLRFKLGESQSNSKESMGRGIRRALILGECPMKTSYVVRDQMYDIEAQVLHTPEGQPIRAADGNFITQDDKWVDAQDGNGTQVLARDPDIEQPLAPIWQKIPLNRRQVLFEGTKTVPIYYKDFLCPLTAEDEQTADTIIHIYDTPVMEFVDLVVKRGMVDDTAEDRLGAAQKMLALVKAMEGNSPAPKAAMNVETRPGENYLSAPSMETGGPVSEFAEFYLWYDANGDGVAENIMLVADRNTKKPIFYDHVANVTTDGLRPIKVLRVNPVEGRWYGVGIMELFESYQNITDLLVNRWNFSQSRSGRVDFWDPTATQEGDRDPNLKMNWGGTYTLKPGKDAKNVLNSVYLTDVKFEQIHEMIQFFMQLAMNESGVANANDGRAAGLASDELATGIIQTQQSGDELFKPIIDELRPGLEAILDREIDTTLANMNPEEVYSYLNGDKYMIGKMTADDVRNMKFKTRIELTTLKNQQNLQVSAQAAAIVEKFYLLPPAVQAKVEHFYRQQLRVLEPTCNVEKTIEAMPNVPPPPPVPKSTVAVTAKIEQLTPPEREQVMKEIGVESPAGENAEQAPPPESSAPNGTKPVNGNTGSRPATGGRPASGPAAKLGKAGAAGSTPHAAQLTQASRMS
jgi:hypothetical protein